MAMRGNDLIVLLLFIGLGPVRGIILDKVSIVGGLGPGRDLGWDKTLDVEKFLDGDAYFHLESEEYTDGDLGKLDVQGYEDLDAVAFVQNLTVRSVRSPGRLPGVPLPLKEASSRSQPQPAKLTLQEIKEIDELSRDAKCTLW